MWKQILDSHNIISHKGAPHKDATHNNASHNNANHNHASHNNASHKATLFVNKTAHRDINHNFMNCSKKLQVLQARISPILML